jgi:ribosome-associated protein
MYLFLDQICRSMPAARTPERKTRHQPLNVAERGFQQPEQDEYVSKGSQKREADEIQRLAQALTDLRASDYAKLPLDEDMRSYLDRARLTTANIARKREVLFIAKQLRKRKDQLQTLFIAIDKPKSEQKKETARMHRLERWRDELINDADQALNEYFKTYPLADRQEVRSLVRAAVVGRTKSHNDGSFSALYKKLAENDAAHTQAAAIHAADATDSED